MRLLCVPLFAAALCCNAQNRFSKRYDSFAQLRPQEGWSVELRPDSGYFVIHMSHLIDQGEDYLLPCILALDPNGNIEALTYAPIDTLHPAIFCGWTNSSDATPGGEIIIGGGRTDVDGLNESALLRFDDSGVFDTLFVYGTNQGYIGRQAKHAWGGYVLVGGCEVNSNYEGFLLKTDANGAQQWVQIYPGPSYDEFVAVDLVPGGGYYLGGVTFISGSNYQRRVVRVNASGGVIWQRVWGGPFPDPGAHLETSSDGHVIVASALRYNNDIGFEHLYLAKLDSADGSFVWEHFYGDSTFNTTLFAVKEVEPFGDLIATGQAFQNNGEVGVLLRTTSAGDSLWLRYYNYHDAFVDSGDAQLRDVLPTPDGGFIAVGVAFGIGPYSQDVWVVKTDSMGCIEPGCHLITGMETQFTNLRGALGVAPNPAASGGNVQVSIKLPESFKPQGQLRLTVVGSDGRLVHEQSMQGTAGQLTTGNLQPGLYHIHLSDATRWISGAKLIIE